MSAIETRDLLFITVLAVSLLAFFGGAAAQDTAPTDTKTTTDVEITVNDSQNGEATATVPLTVEDTASDDVPAEVDATTVNAVVSATDGANDYTQLGTLDILDAYGSYLEDNTVGNTELDSSIPILDLYAYAIENPGEFQ
jgi:hypothetical protein